MSHTIKAICQKPNKIYVIAATNFMERLVTDLLYCQLRMIIAMRAC